MPTRPHVNKPSGKSRGYDVILYRLDPNSVSIEVISPKGLGSYESCCTRSNVVHPLLAIGLGLFAIIVTFEWSIVPVRIPKQKERTSLTSEVYFFFKCSDVFSRRFVSKLAVRIPIAIYPTVKNQPFSRIQWYISIQCVLSINSFIRPSGAACRISAQWFPKCRRRRFFSAHLHCIPHLTTCMLVSR